MLKWGKRGEKMKYRGLSQETLKLIACVTMLIDHIAAVLVIPSDAAMLAGDTTVAWINVFMRGIGRVAFPIFCFLLVEGAHHTRNPRKYALRLSLGMVLSEIPFDLAFFGGPTWAHQSVMVTLLLGFGMIQGMKRVKHIWKLICILPFYLVAEWLHTDYAGEGILIIAMFALVKEVRHENWVRLAGMALLLWDNTAMFQWNLGVPIYYNRIRMLSAVPIFCYDGSKRTYSKAVQWAFYLFYPVHITILLLVKMLCTA